MGLVGDSSRLRNAINAWHQQSAGPRPFPDQAHHLLCSNQILKLEDEYGELAFESGYDLNRHSNGLLMPANYGHQKHPNLQRHRGGHSKKLYSQVRDLVEPIYEDNEGKKPCDDPAVAADILGRLTQCETDARKFIKDLDWELYEHSKVLFDRDYRDEGYGDLGNKTSAPFTGKASGMRWLQDKAIGIKRRFEVVAHKEIVYTPFYVKEGYPVPGGGPPGDPTV